MRILSLILSAAFLITSPMAQAAPTLDVTAQEGIILDADTGQMLWAKEAQMRMPTSSMSKVLTMMVVFDAIKESRLKMTDMLTVSERAWRMEGSKMFIEVGKQIMVEDLIKGVIVQSGNDACVVLAEGIAGSEEAFVELMNKKAEALGMKNSHFMNSTGMPDDNHYSTPEDLALLARQLILTYPEEYKYYSIPEFTYNNIKQGNRNPLLGRVQGADGVKTGHTEIAGYGLIGSAVQNGRRVVMVMNGWPTIMARYEEAPRVMDWAFRNFENVLIAKGNTPLAHLEVAYGDKKNVSVGLAHDLKITQPRGASSSQALRYVVRGKTPMMAPIALNAPVAELAVLRDGQVVTTYPLVAMEEVKDGSILDVIRTNIMNLLQGK